MSQKSFTSREQKLLTILPAALVLVVYSFLIALPKQRAHQSTQRQLETMRTTAVNEAAAEQSEVNLKLARESLNRLKQRTSEDRVSIKDKSQGWRNLDSRLAAVEELTSMMGQYNLSIVSQDYQDEPAVSEYFINLFGEINFESPAAPPVEFWQIEVEGRYNDVQAFLTAIEKDRIKTFPITVNMTASESRNGVHIWTVIFVV